jgi:hypothetical protein
VAGGLSRRGAGAARRLKAWFRGLSSRARLVVAAQLVALCLAVAAAERGAHVRSSYGGPGGIAASRRSIEVSYSSFLDLVEQQQQPQPNQNRGQPPAGRAQAAGPAAVPVMDQVRIGADRIVYRLHRPALAPAAPPSTPVALGTSLPSDGGTAGRRTAIPPRLLQRQRRAQQQRPNQQAPGFVTAYTRKVSASPELVRVLRENGVPFAAASQAPASVLGLAVRSFLATLYFMILWRLYQTISGATGGGGMGGSSLKDSPGKLARASELPLASFDDIQGIDDSKQEVMELVDTLRNPEKYAILGARAPTGLLLEGACGANAIARGSLATTPELRKRGGSIFSLAPTALVHAPFAARSLTLRSLTPMASFRGAQAPRARGRRCWPARRRRRRGSRSCTAAGATLWKCSSGGARPGCGSCSRGRSGWRRASSSSTSWTVRLFRKIIIIAATRFSVALSQRQ